jgi:hypothetical protein
VSLVFAFITVLLVTLTAVMSSLPIVAQSPTQTPTAIGTLSPTPSATSGFGLFSVLPNDEGIDYPAFHPSDVGSSGTLNIVGAAFIPNHTLRLTTYNHLTEYAGAMWSQSKQFVEDGFETTFEFQVSQPVNDGGDGFAFVIQNDDEEVQGDGGCGNGYGSIQHSLIVEFDLYWNDINGVACEEVDDSSDNHLGIMYNGNVLHTDPDLVHDIPKNVLDMKDGLVHTVVIRYDSIASTLNIKIDDVVDWTETVNLSLASPDINGRMWVGLVGGTGIARQNHNILSWSFRRLTQSVTNTPEPTASTTPSPAPTRSHTYTPVLTTTATACTISFTSPTFTTSTKLSVFRAPIEGNPLENKQFPITIPLNTSLTVDGFAIDPLTNHIWLHLGGLRAFQT